MKNRKEKLIELITSMKVKSPRLKTPYGFFPTKGGDSGDDTLWLGLLASVKYDRAFQGVMHCQASPHEKRPGMFYRNPRRRSNDNAGHDHYFSRDMALGVLLAYASYDKPYLKDSAKSWLQYIKKNRACAVKKPGWMGGGCLIRSPIYRYSPDDDRGNITPTMWAMMGRVWKARGWHRSGQMKQFEGTDGDVSVIEAQNAPLGYRLHLKAVQAYIKIILGQSKEYYQKVAYICQERQPTNLFYNVLCAETASNRLVDWYLTVCPDPDIFKPHDSWLWEKDKQDPFNSCGWDWVFLGHLLLSMLNKEI